MRRSLCAAALCLAIAGCANPAAQFYQGLTDVKSHPRYDSSEAGVRIFVSDDLGRDERELFRRGYARFGQSFFNANSEAVTEAQVREQAATLGAHIVLVSSKHSHTVTGATSLYLPTNSRSYSTGIASALTPAGTVSVLGSSMTTTRGSQVVMVPYSVTRSDFGIVFFAKQKQRVGILLAPIDDETRRRLVTNAGIRVEAVADGSPAFIANVLPGDILLSISGEPISSLDGYLSIVKKSEGRQVLFEFDRDGERIRKELTVHNFPSR